LGPTRSDPVVTITVRDSRRRANPGHAVRAVTGSSTAIARIAARPAIDVVPLLRRDQDRFACVGPMAAKGLQFRCDGGLSSRHDFVEGQPKLHQVDVCASYHQRSNATAAFRDDLRAHPDQPSRRLARRRPGDGRADRRGFERSGRSWARMTT
jgi:GrpB-like predicted nucleotidyltransferase (UPF0157 family)